ncbi:unnamed protein product [Rhizoctonia solani]|uniref:Uncharacterized protein n=1 Tax=Rhizoctonia solani TaxID=456999 RepID=A0A8H2WY26_9AGAM|nr:unnamed protein product [Rhizoctonia solani]
MPAGQESRLYLTGVIATGHPAYLKGVGVHGVDYKPAYAHNCGTFTAPPPPHSLSSPTTLAEPTPCTFLAALILFRYLQQLYSVLNGWLQPPKPSGDDDSAGVGTVAPEEPQATEISQSLPRTSLPLELVERIADFLFQAIPSAQDSPEPASILCVKPSWRDVAGFMGASLELHKMGYRRWLQIISVKNVNDWNTITEHIELIREIHCFDGTLLNPKHQANLSNIPHLYAATIDSHSDVWHDERNRFAYRDILSTLPPSLKRLEIEHAHGPDIKIISLAKEYCPKLEELILGRCTMFNRSPACDFWSSFPHDHDAYMSMVGTDAYAHSLGNELAPLKHLRLIRVGLYFVPSDIVLAHRLYHRRGLSAPATIRWQSAIPLAELTPNPEPATTAQLVSLLHRRDEESQTEFKCLMCADITDTSGSEAEKIANSILHEYLPKLACVEWMGWLTPGHLGVHSYRFSS